ncbi:MULTISPECIES: hypothetical protein [unclassified Roseateles]|uniref:hypothetical protein n=1 Tax=unclassified Roseateles TaxID=2626991 RepID=UPI0006F391BD|nr:MULTISPECIES: hypothetical protein [unclassified Roseateles]KQW50797.1 hypothetical protein ASC81_24180 [Pelomonas sp. Root405]KRA70844.1 hypothetical protein ASD88_13435 [Pelomonas sp. Root662]
MASGLIVRNAVRKLLQSSPSYRELPADKQREIAQDTVRVASYMADPHGLLSKKPPAQVAAPHAAATRTAAKGARGPAAAHLAALRDPRAVDAAAATAIMLQTVDFPDFVGDLVKGVFNAVVDASIQQMQAYAELIKQVADAVDRFKQDNIGTAQARDWLTQRFGAELERDPRGRLRWCVDPDAGACAVASALLLSSPTTDTRELVAAARRRMAVDRQQLLATTVLMGINRIVVTDGKIRQR